MVLPMPNWSELPEELVSIISEKLYFYEDFIRFSVVCHPWRSALTFKYEQRRDHFLKSFPWLMLPEKEEEEEEEEDDNHRFFFSPFQNQIRRLSLPEARGCRCWGSPYGWLLTFDFDQQFHLLNPLSRIRLPLPPRSTFHDSSFNSNLRHAQSAHCVTKAIVCTDANDQIVAYLIIGGYQQLAFARSGDKTWTVVKHSTFQQDVIHFKGRIYTVKSGKVGIMVYRGDRHPVLYKFVDFPDDVLVEECVQSFLVELVGELHLVVRTLDHTRKKTIYFEVYRLDLTTHKWDEEKLQTLGDYALFIGNNTSFALKASDYPECKPGCIYFTDNCDEGGDMGIYNLETKRFEPVYEGDNILSRFSPPVVWIMPKPF